MLTYVTSPGSPLLKKRFDTVRTAPYLTLTVLDETRVVITPLVLREAQEAQKGVKPV